MIVISDSVVLAQSQPGAEVGADNPRIGWHTVLTANNVAADEEDDDHPVENLANTLTYLKWAGTSTAEQSVTVTLNSPDTVNYIGIARHNFGSTGASYVVQYSDNGSDWTDLTEERVPSSDYVLIHEFEDTEAQYFRLNITPGSAPPEIAVLYMGQILRMQRRVYVGHTPFPFARKSTVSSGFSESGQFLGRVRRRSMYQVSAEFQNLTPDWVRDELQEFFDVSDTTPFFWAWRPSTYPDEVGFAWMMSDPTLSNQRSNGMMSASFRMQGIR